MMRSSQTDSKPDTGFQWAEVDFADLWFLFRSHWRLVTLLPLLFAVIAIVFCFSVRPTFSSTAVLYLRPNFDREMLLEPTFSKLEDADSLRSVERAVISDTVILRMIDRLDLRDDLSFTGEAPSTGLRFTDDALLNKIRKRYRTKLLPNTRLVELEVDDYSPQRSKLIARHRVEREMMDRGQRARWANEVAERSGRLAKGFSGLWQRITGSRGKIIRR
ncbi:MAG: Wzz/FepE/Etk N-terminal domain-containing protein, partial [Verrucomicrobiota bacterium]